MEAQKTAVEAIVALTGVDRKVVAEFIRRFPGESGYRGFLIDAPAASTDALVRALSIVSSLLAASQPA